MKKRDLSKCACPVEYALELLSGKWTTRIIWLIGKNDVVRYNALQRQLPGISSLMLTQTLQEICEAGIVNRKQYNEVPPRVEYSLTERGLAIMPIYGILESWGKECGWKNPDGEDAAEYPSIAAVCAGKNG